MSPTQRESCTRVRFDCDKAETNGGSPSPGPVTTSGNNSSNKPTAPEGVAVEPSLQIVPYIPRDAQPLFTLLSKERHAPQILQASTIPRHFLVSDASMGLAPSPPPPPSPPSSPPGQLGGKAEPQLQFGSVLPRVRCPSKCISARNHQAKEINSAILHEFVFRSPARSPRGYSKAIVEAWVYTFPSSFAPLMQGKSSPGDLVCQSKSDTPTLPIA